MPGTDNRETAEAKMNAAQTRLLSYIERREAVDRDQYRRLAAQFKKAQAEFMRALERGEE